MSQIFLVFACLFVCPSSSRSALLSTAVSSRLVSSGGFCKPPGRPDSFLGLVEFAAEG